MKNNFFYHTVAAVFIQIAGCSANPRPPINSGLGFPELEPANVDTSVYTSVLDGASLVDASGHNDGSIYNFPEGSRIVGVREGGTVPFNGVLFNSVAAAAVEVETRTGLERCRINSRFELELLAATSLRDIQRLQNASQAQQRAFQMLILNRNTTINQYETYSNRLRQQAEGETMRNIGFSIGGLILGGLVTGLAVGLIPRN